MLLNYSLWKVITLLVTLLLRNSLATLVMCKNNISTDKIMWVLTIITPCCINNNWLKIIDNLFLLRVSTRLSWLWRASNLFICLLIPSFLLSFLLYFNTLWWELLGVTITKSLSPLLNDPLTLHNPAAWQRESRKSSLCLPWAHRLSPSPKPAQTEVFITEEEWAQKRGELMKRWRWHLFDLSCVN